MQKITLLFPCRKSDGAITGINTTVHTTSSLLFHLHGSYNRSHTLEAAHISNCARS